MNFRELANKIGLTSAAIVLCLAEKGEVVMRELLAGRGRGLGRSLREIEDTRDVHDYYEILKNLKENSARTIIWRLKKKGLVKNDRGKISLTKNGTLLSEKLKGVAWDEKWRIVMFDIPESKRKQRLWLMFSLKNMNYNSLQKSVFIGKYPLDQDFIEDLLEKYLYKFVRIITIGEIDDDKFLKI